MKVAYIVNDYPKVSHSFIRREILALERQGIEVQRIAIRGWEDKLPDSADLAERERTQYILKAGVWPVIWSALATFLRTPFRFLSALRLALKVAGNSDRSVAHHLFYLAEACHILPWLRASGVRRLHAHFGTNSTDLAMLASTLSDLPFSFTVHGPEEFLRPIGLTEKIHRADFVVAISSFGRSQLSLWTPYADWSKIKVVHCGLEPSFYEDSPPTVSLAPRLVCVGRFVPEKGQFLLVEAIARLAARGVRVDLVLAGDGQTRKQLEESIRKFQLSDCVRITGWIDGRQVREEILAARALILPTFAEGLPVVIMEAMALRRPIITTFVAGIPELVIPGHTGWLIPASSLDELVRAIEECLALSEGELRQMGENGRARAIERHAIDPQAERLAGHFRTAPTKGT